MSGKNVFRTFVCGVLLSSPQLAADDGWTVRDTSLAPYEGAFAEFCVAVPAGGTLDIELTATRAIDFNVHFHTDTDTLFSVRERVEREAAFTVPADAAGSYCLTWTNPEQRQETTQVRTRYRVH